MKKIVFVSILLSSGHFVSAQNVGIGTAAPSEKLHVVGGARITNLSGVGNRLVSSSPTGVLGNITDGTAGQFLTTNGAGNYTWATSAAPVPTTAQNGLYYNGVNTSIQLGGPLTENTTITQGNFGMNWNLNGTGDFRIQSNTQANQFFVDASTNRIGIRTAAPTSMLQMVNNGVNVGANAMASFENAGFEGVSIDGYNYDVTNGYNAIEGIVSYSGTAYNAAGVFGLAIDNTLINSAIGVRGTINGRDGFGVLGTRANGAGAGWAGLFIEDLGYTGFFGAASDARTKKDINPINGALAIVNQLNPVTYFFDLEKFPNMGLNREMEYGFIAQEVREILPEITRVKNLPTNGTVEVSPNSPVENKNELFVMIDYTRVIPILTKAVQEQQAIIETQNEKIELLQKQMEEIKTLLEQQ
ncbi:MAG: hypothetical protein ACJASQ_000834 [Crocinitomicaceae bacterium]|jgi:hypothetical protein